MLFDEASSSLRPTPNLETLARAVRLLNGLGVAAPVVDAPSANCVATMATLASAGATHVEPGSSLIGNTPLHAVSDEPEEPAMVYVTEVSHRDDDTTYTLGGGHYARSRVRQALVLTADGPKLANAEALAPDAIDYYGALKPAVDRAREGDTALYAFRSQVFVTRASVAAVAGIGTNPRFVGLYDRAGHLFDPDCRPTGATTAYAIQRS
jgi:predicted amino acid racemase